MLIFAPYATCCSGLRNTWLLSVCPSSVQFLSDFYIYIKDCISNDMDKFEIQSWSFIFKRVMLPSNALYLQSWFIEYECFAEFTCSCDAFLISTFAFYYFTKLQVGLISLCQQFIIQRGIKKAITIEFWPSHKKNMWQTDSIKKNHEKNHFIYRKPKIVSWRRFFYVSQARTEYCLSFTEILVCQNWKLLGRMAKTGMVYFHSVEFFIWIISYQDKLHEMKSDILTI